MAHSPLKPSLRMLIVSYHFGTAGAVGGLRWNRLAKYLAKSGCQIDVVSGAPSGVAFPPGVTGHHRPRRPTLRDRYVSWRESKQTDSPTPTVPVDPPPTEMRGKPRWWRRVIDRIRLEAAVALFAPDEARGWTLRAARTARHLLRTADIDVVISSGPPHLAHVAAWLATRGTATPWIADLRDPWWYHPDAASWESEPLFRSVVNRSLNLVLESVALRRCSAVLCTNEPFASALSRHYPRLRVTALPNGIDDELLPARLSKSNGSVPPSIVHMGTVYGNRDLRPVVAAAAQLGADTAGGPPITVRAVGDIPQDHAEALKKAAAEAGSGVNLEILPAVDRETAWEILRQASAAVVLAQRQPFQIPAKLYEAAWLTSTVLVLAEPGSASWIEGHRLGTILLDPTDSGATAEVLDRLRNGELRPHPLPVERTYTVLAQRVADFVASLRAGI